MGCSQKNPTKNHYLGNLQINQKSQPALKSKEPYTQISKWVLTKSIKQYKTTLKNILKSFLGSVTDLFLYPFWFRRRRRRGHQTVIDKNKG